VGRFIGVSSRDAGGVLTPGVLDPLCPGNRVLRVTLGNFPVLPTVET
jgi:hypothetical protein